MRLTLTAVIGLVVIAAFAIASRHQTGEPVRRAASLPANVVVIETDDQTAELIRFMPAVRRLVGRRGVTFRNSFVSYPLCCPSRATFLTGQYAHNHGVRENSEPTGGYTHLDHSRTLPVWLQRAGYRTVMVGKYLNGYGQKYPREIPPGWTRWHGLIDPTTGRMYGYSINDNGTVVQHGGTPADYQTTLLARTAVREVRSAAAKHKPLFMWVTPLAPHDELRSGNRQQNPRAAPRDQGRLTNVTLPPTPAFDEADVSDKPAFVRAHGRIDHTNVSEITRSYGDRARSLLAVDRLVSDVVFALKRAHQLGNTYVIFTSDNGFMFGEHRIGTSKNVVYEPSVRVPLLIRGPGVVRNHTVSDIVANIDLAPTIARIAKARPDRVMDGVSLLPLLNGRRLPSKRVLLLEEGDGSAPKNNKSTPDYEAIRTAGWLWVEYKTGERELYDMHADPAQLTNLAADPARDAVRGDLAARLATLRSCTGSGCRR